MVMAGQPGGTASNLLHNRGRTTVTDQRFATGHTQDAIHTVPSHDGNPLAGRTIAILATDGVEEVELTEPAAALKQAGARTVLVSPASGTIQAGTPVTVSSTSDR